MRKRRPNASSGARTVDSWVATERLEFEAEVREMADYFGYAWSTELLTSDAEVQRSGAWSGLLRTLTQAAAPARPD